MASAVAVQRATVSRVSGRARGVVTAGVGAVVVLAGWWLLAELLRPSGALLPTPWAVVRQLGADGFGFYWSNFSVTLIEALLGYIIGVSAGIVLAALTLLWRRADSVITQLAVITYCVPPVAIAPVVFLLIGAPSSGAPSGTAICITAIIMIFIVFTNTVLGFRSAGTRSLELVQVYGGGRWQQLRRVQVPSAVPAVIEGLKIAAPLSVIGAILGEYAGGVDVGIGPTLLTAQRQANATRTFAIALLAAAVAGLAFAVLTLIQRWIRHVLPGAGEVNTTGGGSSHRKVRGFGHTATIVGASAVIIVGAWWAGLRVFGVSPYVSKTPADIWNYLLNDPEAGANRVALLGNAGVTLLDASFGFVAGLVIAGLLAVLFTLVPAAARGLMPWILVVQLMPLVAMAPVIILLFGRGFTTLAVLAGIIVFFPALINLMMGLRAAPPALGDLVAAYGGGPLSFLQKVRLASSLPAVFASVKIGIPAAINGAILAEWLATGEGVGGAITAAMSRGENIVVWANVTVITVIALVLYGLVSVLESRMLTRVGM